MLGPIGSRGGEPPTARASGEHGEARDPAFADAEPILAWSDRQHRVLLPHLVQVHAAALDLALRVAAALRPARREHHFEERRRPDLAPLDVPRGPIGVPPVCTSAAGIKRGSWVIGWSAESSFRVRAD